MRRIFLAIAVLVCAASLAGNAHALSFFLETEYTGGAEPVGSLPWLTATFEDTGADTVRLTLDAGNLSGAEFVAGWYFNYDPIIPLPIIFTYDSGASTGPAAGVSIIQNGHDAGGAPGFGFDIFLNFPQSNGSRFDAGEIVYYDIAGDGLSAASFEFLNAAGNFYSAAHVQAIATPPGSGWIAAGSVPQIHEPATLILLGLGLFGCGIAARRKLTR